MRNDLEIKAALDYFTQTAEYKMLGHRQDGFRTAMQHLLAQEKDFIIIETGSLRSHDTPESWFGDGRSTAVWGMFLDSFDRTLELCKQVVTIDLDKNAIDNAARIDFRVEPVLGDSLKVLPDLAGLYRCKLLYLDSFDWSSAKNQESAWHHMTELALVYASLPVGCMIMVDDAHDEFDGKHWVVAEFFKTIGVEPTVRGYQWAWIKPSNSL